MRFSLQSKMLLSIILVLILCASSCIYYIHTRTNRVVVHEIGLTQAKEASMVKHFVEEWLGYAVNDVMVWGTVPVFIDAVTETGYYGERAVEESRRRLAALANKYKQFAAVHIYRLDGNLAASSFPTDFFECKVTNMADRDYFKAAASGESHISKMIRSRYTLERLFVISAPIKREGKVVGVVVGEVFTEALSMALKDLGRLRKNTEIFFLDVDNYPIISSLQKIKDENIPPINGRMKNILENIEKKSSSIKDQTMCSNRYVREGNYIYVFSFLKYNNWKIAEVSSLDTVVMTSFMVLKYSIFVIFLAIFLATIILFVLFRKYIFSRLTHLQKKIQLVEQGKLATRITSDKKTDEISSLVHSFNKMAAHLQDSVGALRSSREQFQVAVDGSNDGIWDWDLVRDKVYFSPRWYAQLGYKEDELGSSDYSTFTALLHKDDIERVDNYIQRFLQSNTRKKFDIEFRMTHKNGSVRWIRSRAAMLHDENGQPYRIAGAHTDVTKEHKVSEQIVKAKEEAESSNRYKSEFLANMSHEIRTPIGFITGLCYMMQDTSLDEKQRDYVEKIQKSAKTLLYLVNDILDFSKIEAGRLEIDEQPVHLGEILDSVIESFRPAASKKNIRLTRSISPDMPEILESDPLRLGQVLNNLVNNAIKFTREGEIAVDARCLQKHKEYVELEIVVRDTGIGMTKEQQTRIFKAFSQADSSITKQFGGTGLGLVISRDLLNLLGGSVSVQSEYGKGTTFIINLKLRYIEERDANKEGEAAPSSETRSGFFSEEERHEHFPDAQVLLVEDNKINLMIAESLLEKVGIIPECAKNGVEALKRVQEKDYDIILMDVQMPVMDGYTATEKIRSFNEEKYKRVPIIAMTANAMNQDVEKALVVGMNDHLSKPIDPEKFYALIRQYLSP